MEQEYFKFEWQKAIMSKYGPKSVTRLVLMALSIFMDMKGICFPSTTSISEAAGLSERSVCTHLENSANAGWIEKTIAGFNGQGWKRHKYQAIIPEKVVNEVQYVNDKALKDVQYVNDKGTEPHDIKALKEVQSNKTKNNTIKDIYAVVSYLNEKTGTNYKPTTLKTQAFIKARMAEGYSVENFKTVIDHKCDDWKADPINYKYLRPETLFGTKFESYLQNATTQPKNRPQMPRN